MNLWDARCDKHGRLVKFTTGMTKLIHADAELLGRIEECNSTVFIRYGVEYDKLELFAVVTLDQVLSIVDLGLSWSAA